MLREQLRVQRVELFGMLQRTLGASLLGNILAGKSIVRASNEIIRVGDRVIRAR